jgi:ribose 5-phosphate isomerase B
MRIGVGADQWGFRLKEALKDHLAAQGHEISDFGVFGEEAVDYPDVAAPVARAIAAGSLDRAVLCCGTGLGMAIAANKVPGVRAGTVSDPYSAERLAKSNNAQVICFGGRVVAADVATLLVDHFMAAEFQGGDSSRKVDKISALERSPEAAPGTAGGAAAEKAEA